MLHTEKDPPEKDGKYYATYKVNLPEAGAYNMTFAGLSIIHRRFGERRRDNKFNDRMCCIKKD